MITGHYETEFPRNYGVPMRGWDPQNPTTLSISLPPSPTAKDGVTPIIWEAHILTPLKNGKGWELGCPADNAHPGIVAFAQNSTFDTDVRSANQLVGLSCSGKFRIATPFFARTVATTPGSTTHADHTVCSYAIGTPVTFCRNNENHIVTKPTGTYTGSAQDVEQVFVSTRGYIRPAKAGEEVIGVVVDATPDAPTSAIGALNYNAPAVTRVGSGVACEDSTTKYFMPSQAVALKHTWKDTVDSSAETNNSYYVIIDTTYAPTV